jgi:hypothetical protein
MRADPEPDDLLVLLYSYSPIVFGDTQREDRPCGVYSLKMKARVVRSLLKVLYAFFASFLVSMESP